MLYRHHITQDGIEEGEIKALRAQLAPALGDMASGRDEKAAPLLALAALTSDLDSIERLAAEIRSRFDRVVVAGMGGSGLSGRALANLRPAMCAARFYFLENIDPWAMDELLGNFEIEKTCFIVISKSGETLETLSQFFILFDHVKKAVGSEGARERFVIITEPGENPLRQSAAEQGLRLLDHPKDIGGRFAILTSVGLLPAAIAGLDIRALRRGAQWALAHKDHAAEGAAWQYASMQKNYPMTVLLPYSQRLEGLSMWWRQCWAESLGKMGKGSTPVPALGATDQHSQLQLWLDGPKDKIFTLILPDHGGQGPRIPAPEDSTFDHIREKTLGDVMQAEQQATLETLLRHHCRVRLFQLASLAEEQMGALLMHFMLEIILTARLLGVDPFGQPAVEEGKRLARDYLLKGAS